MSIVFDSSIQANQTGTTGGSHDLTASLTLSASSVLAVVFVHRTNPSLSVNSVTLNGVAMALGPALSTNDLIDSFYLFNPPTGAQTVDLNYTESSSSHQITFHARSYTGPVTQTLDPNSTTGNSASTTALGVSITPSVANSMVVGFSAQSGGQTPSSITNGTNKVDVQGSSFDSGQITGATTFTANYAGPAAAGMVLLSFAPVAFTKTGSLTMMNGSGRAAIVNKGLTPDGISLTMTHAMTAVRNKTFTVTLTMMNAASRLISMLSHGPSWTRTSKPSTTWTDQSKP